MLVLVDFSIFEMVEVAVLIASYKRHSSFTQLVFK